MVSRTFYDRSRTGVTYGKTLTDLSADIESSAGRTIQTGVAAQCEVWTGLGRGDDDASAVHPFTDVVIARTVKVNADTFSEEGTQRLPRHTCQVEGDGIFRKPFVTVSCSDLTRNACTETSVEVADSLFQYNRLAWIFNRRHQLLDDRFFIFVLVIRLIERYLTSIDPLDLLQQLLKIELLGELVIDHLQQFGLPDDLFKTSVTKLREDLSDLFGKQGEVVDDLLYISFEACS